LVSINATTSSCNVTITGGTTGTIIASATYTPTDTTHSGSGPTTSNTVTVGGRSSATSVSCTPATVVVNQVITCTGFVKDTATGTPSAPGGTVAFTNGGTATGSFTGSPCTLATVNATTSSCNVTFNPTASGTVIASGTYSPTDNVHSGSGPTAGNTVTVNRRTTSTAVSCTPLAVVVNQVITCTGFAKDTSVAGTASAPAGTVAFTNGGTAAGSFIGSPCTLASVNATTSSCNVTFNPTNAGTVIATGTYTSTDAAHSGSGPTAGNTVTVTLRTTSTAVSCSPATVVVAQTISCTGFVRDTSTAGTAS